MSGLCSMHSSRIGTDTVLVGET